MEADFITKKYAHMLTEKFNKTKFDSIDFSITTSILSVLFSA